ncbi:MAG: 5-formyltetrahydrofolate cyclo-ligase [Salinibacterium sp.]|nr:MAG: 5-formyltetrahydrofolate cyclo-ligase [Salinibacterium sp.]
MTGDVSHQKRALRAELRERRRITTSTARQRADAALTQHLVELTRSLGANSVATYLSLPEEPSTRGLLAWARTSGVRVLLPISRPDGLLDWVPFEGDDETQDAFGMPTPSGDLLGPIAVNEVDLMLVPAASVDRDGMRLGWGRGFFDRTLGSMETRPPVYAVIFDDEFVDSVPNERHDQRVDGVVTPSGITAF